MQIVKRSFLNWWFSALVIGGLLSFTFFSTPIIHALGSYYNYLPLILKGS